MKIDPYVKVSKKLLLAKELTDTQYRLGCLLISYDHKGTNECWPSIARLADDLGWSYSKTSRNLKAMERGGWIEIVSGKKEHDSNRYKIVILRQPDLRMPRGTTEHPRRNASFMELFASGWNESATSSYGNPEHANNYPRPEEIDAFARRQREGDSPKETGRSMYWHLHRWQDRAQVPQSA